MNIMTRAPRAELKYNDGSLLSLPRSDIALPSIVCACVCACACVCVCAASFLDEAYALNAGGGGSNGSGGGFSFPNLFGGNK